MSNSVEIGPNSVQIVSNNVQSLFRKCPDSVGIMSHSDNSSDGVGIVSNRVGIEFNNIEVVSEWCRIVSGTWTLSHDEGS